MKMIYGHFGALKQRPSRANIRRLAPIQEVSEEFFSEAPSLGRQASATSRFFLENRVSIASFRR